MADQPVRQPLACGCCEGGDDLRCQTLEDQTINLLLEDPLEFLWCLTREGLEKACMHLVNIEITGDLVVGCLPTTWEETNN